MCMAYNMHLGKEITTRLMLTMMTQIILKKIMKSVQNYLKVYGNTYIEILNISAQVNWGNSQISAKNAAFSDKYNI